MKICNVFLLKLRPNNAECQLCQTGVAEIRTLLRDASVQRQIEAVLKTDVCSHLGALEKYVRITDTI